jgi:uncharacterized damage-inducible protein DinB
MNVSADVLRTHLDYTNWATNRLLEHAAQLSAEELTRDFGTADKSVLQTLAHVYAADNIWLARVQQAATMPRMKASELTFEFLQREWPGLQDRWKVYAAVLTDDAVNGEISYSALNGQQFTQPLWQLLLHIVNHATHHRGQASGFLRAMEKVPAPLDLVAYYRQLGPWKL